MTYFHHYYYNSLIANNEVFFFINIVILSHAKCSAQENLLYSDPYEMVEVMGGLDSLYASTSNLHVLPEKCSEIGKSFLQLVISSNGQLVSCHSVKGVCPEADSIACQIASQLRYKPAQKNGIPYESFFILPIPFEKEQ